MTAKNLFDKLIKIQNDLDFTSKDYMFNNNAQGLRGLSEKKNSTLTENEIINLVSNYNLHYVPNIFRDIRIEEELEYDEEFIIFANYEGMLICYNTLNEEITWNEIMSFHELSKCAISPDNFLEVLYEIADFSLRYPNAEEKERKNLIPKLVELSGDKESKTFYTSVMGVID